MLSNIAGRVRRTAADAFILFLLPGFAALLPWSLGFALLKRCARSPRLYREATEPAWAAAREHCPGSDEKKWKYHYRLLRLVDHVDSYLTLLRGERWWRRHIDQYGEWPESRDARVFLTYHWGAGHWIWRRLRAQGFNARFLVKRVQGQALGYGRVSHWYGKFRAWAIRRIGSDGPLFIGGSGDAVNRELHAGGSIVGMLDLPASPTQRAMEMGLLDGRARFPLGLAHLAVGAGAGISLFSAGLDPGSGRRKLWIENLPAGVSAEETMRCYIAHLDQRLRAMPEFWQIWREAPLIFVATDAASTGQAL